MLMFVDMDIKIYSIVLSKMGGLWSMTAYAVAGYMKGTCVKQKSERLSSKPK